MGNNSEKNALFCKSIRKKMKRISIVLFIALALGLLMASCGSSSTCPAYGETSKYQIETRY